MKVLMVHNYYQQPGGEDLSFASERALLVEHGVEVETYTLDNAVIDDLSKFAVASKTIWNRSAHRELNIAVSRARPDVVHFQNTFPLVSPSGYYAAQRGGAAVVQSVRNFRLACPNALFFRDGRVCTDCKGKAVPWPGVLHACYRESRPATAVVAGMLSLHRTLGSWKRQVDRFIVLTDFQRRQLEGVIPADRTVTKPNFIHPDPGLGSGDGEYAVYVGRLSSEKGIGTLIRAWANGGSEYPLRIIGDGPLSIEVAHAIRECKNIESLGRRTPGEVLELVGAASLLVFPSEWFEGFPRTILEAYSRGTPVLAAGIGSAGEVVVPGRTGALFRAGDPRDLRRAATELLSDADELSSLRRTAREEFELKYTGAHNFDILMGIYEEAIKSKRSGALHA